MANYKGQRVREQSEWDTTRDRVWKNSQNGTLLGMECERKVRMAHY